MSDKTQQMSSMTGAEIKDARERLGLTQEQFSCVLGLSGGSYVSKVERGLVFFRETTLRLLQAYLEGYRPKDWPLKK